MVPSNVTSASDYVVAPAAHTGKGAFHALSASSIGLEMGISVVLGLLFGMYLDRELGTTPWLMLAFLGFGLVAGFRGVFRAVRRAERGYAERTEAERPMQRPEEPSRG